MKSLLMIMAIVLLAMPLHGYVWEGFERENFWSVTVMNKNAVNSISIVNDKKTEGKNSLLIDLGKTGSRKGFVSREGSLDLSKIKEIHFDLYIEKPVNVSVGLSTGASYTWFETMPYILKRGWNKDLKMDLTKKQWKSAAKGWEPMDIPTNLNDTKKIAFVFMNGRSGKVYLDNVCFIGGNIKNDAYSMPFEPFDQSKLFDDTSLLDDIMIAGWAKEKSPGAKKEGKKYVLEYDKVDNVNKAAYKVQFDMNWEDYSKMLIKLKNASKSYSALAIGIQTGNGWVWHESPQYLLKPKKTTEVTILLNAPYFKTENTDWKYITHLYDKNQVKSINFLIYGVFGTKSSGKVEIESFKLMKGKPFTPPERPDEGEDEEDEEEEE